MRYNSRNDKPSLSTKRPMMTITKIRISNFKSFNDQCIALNDFNLLVGSNASGKSNLVQAFQFLRDIVTHGLEDAISLQGGVEYLRNVKIANTRPLSFHVVVQPHMIIHPVSLGNGQGTNTVRQVKIHTFDYEFSLRFHKRGSGYTIEQDRMTLTYEDSVSDDGKLTDSAKLTIENSAGKLRISSTSPDRGPLSALRDQTIQIPKKTLLIEAPFAYIAYAGAILNWVQAIGIYDFDPKLSKRAIPIAGRSGLEMDGSNLAIVLNNVISDKEKRRSFLNLCRYLLPFIDSIDVEKGANRSIFFKLREKYSKDDLPSFLISDGTVNIIALLIALYFQQKPFAIIEEPERNIHPYLISKLMDMFREASQQKQILATTHNPEMVKQAELENLLLVTRDKEGFSQITKPANSEQVKIFLENEIGIDELFVDNLLGI